MSLQRTHTVKTVEDIEKVKPQIAEAYEKNQIETILAIISYYSIAKSLPYMICNILYCIYNVI